MIDAPEKVVITREDRSIDGISHSAFALTFVAGLNGGWLGPLIPAIAAAQKIPIDQVGLIVSLLCAGCFVSQLFGSKILQKIGGKKSLLTGSAMLSLGMLGLAFAQGTPALLAMAFITGLGTGMNGVAGHVSIINFHKDKAASALSKLNIFYGIGALLAPMVVLALLKNTGYHNIFLISAVSAALVALNLLRLPSLPIAKSESTQKSKGLLSPLLVMLALTVFCYVGTETTVGTWLYTYLSGRGISAAQASMGMSIIFTGLTIGRLISIRLCLSIDPVKVTLFAMSLMTLALTLLLLSTNPYLTLFSVFLVGSGFGPIYPNLIARTAKLFPERVSQVTALAISSGAIGGTLMPGIAGQVMAHFGLSATMIFILSGSLAMMATFIWALKTAKSKIIEAA